MAEFLIKAKDAAGRDVQVTVVADSDAVAAKVAMAKHLVPVSVTNQKDRGILSVLNVFRPIPMRQKVIFARQLSTMINAGLPIVQSLTTLSEQTTSDRFREVISELALDVQGGVPLATALEKHPDIFSRIFVTLVASGEASGTLDKVLARVAEQMEKEYNLLAKIRGALLYPLFVVVLIITVMIFMTVFIIPRFEEFYRSLGASIPGPTQVMVGLANFIARFWWLVLPVVILIVAGARRFLKTPAGRRVVDPLKIQIPGVGVLVRAIYMARFSRTLGTLIGSGVPVLDSLSITAEAMNNYVYSDAVLTAAQEVKRGAPLSAPLHKSRLFPPIVDQMIRVGEQTGELDTMLLKLADFYDEEIDTLSRNLTALIEPILIVVVGGFVLLFIITIMLPVYGIVFKFAGSPAGTVL